MLPNNFVLSTDKTLLNVELIHNFLSQSYWAKGRSLEAVKTTIEHSFCVGLYDNHHQVGFARVVSDHYIFAYIMDVFILDQYRGQGLGQYLMHYLLKESELKEVKKWMLGTKDAHGLYRKFGFTDIQSPELWMQYTNS